MEMLNWVSPNQDLLPDFIIGGAMKSGTSTLHKILNAHPKVFIPKDEIHFFDIDNILQHSDFNFFNEKNKSWTSQSMAESPEVLWNWYLKKFTEKGKFTVGEDSTTYLSSKIAAKRIALQEKSIKLIFLLRYPTERAYSSYWHLLRSGRAMYNFEKTLLYHPESVLSRSLYKEQLEFYYESLPKEDIKVVLFEDLIKHPEQTVKGVCDFLDIDFSKIPKSSFQSYVNKGTIPRSIRMQIIKNRLFRDWGNSHYINSLPYGPKSTKFSIPKSFMGLLNKIHNRINPSLKMDIPKMNDSTRSFLDTYFQQELFGIDELIGEPILNRWFK